ncbi:elongation factor Tu [Streptococcus sanguinis]|uniref:elongation factor Tu n=1 Tax=Streptococcus sanguinis TaxID=1305 RepID=UPI002284D368|nr:elongation factor Tu [Streptococcus sanguinis]MCY7029296.1 elongation factor Tu [Streptococcus sanguinis]
MENLYLVKDENQLAAFRDFVAKNAAKLQDYLTFLKDEFAVYDLPQAIIWSDFDSATQIIREISVPAYTNDRRMVMNPELTVWKDLYLLQLENYESSHQTQAIANHYQSLSEKSLLQILGHELAHWSEHFLDDFNGYGAYIWFEEGMVEYISRKYFFTDEGFQTEKACNQSLVKLFQKKHGWHSLNDFGTSTYQGNYASIFYEYWRSFLTVDKLVENLGSVQAVFDSYHRWANTDKTIPLLDWFIQQKIIDKEI